MNALLASVKKLVFQSGIGPYSVAMHKPSARWNPAFDQRHARIAVARFSSVMRVFGTGGTESGGGGGGEKQSFLHPHQTTGPSFTLGHQNLA
jgi:uncharacterized membrane protein